MISLVWSWANVSGNDRGYHVLGEPALNNLVEELTTTNLLVKVLGDQLGKGIEQGRRQAILRILSRRYTTVPEAMIEHIEQTTDPARLDALLDAAVDARSLEEFAEALNG